MITEEGRGAAVRQASHNSTSDSRSKKIPVDISRLAPSHTVKACKHKTYPVEADDGKNACLKKALWDDNDDTFGMIDRATTSLRRNIIAMTREVAARCDGARSKDNHGFNKWDADVGNRIAKFGIEYPALIRHVCMIDDKDYKPLVWDSEYLRRWAQKLWSYRNQIAGDFYSRMFMGDE